jgi:hypothetical protein
VPSVRTYETAKVIAYLHRYGSSADDFTVQRVSRDGTKIVIREYDQGGAGAYVLLAADREEPVRPKWPIEPNGEVWLDENCEPVAWVEGGPGLRIRFRTGRVLERPRSASRRFEWSQFGDYFFVGDRLTGTFELFRTDRPDAPIASAEKLDHAYPGAIVTRGDEVLLVSYEVPDGVPNCYVIDASRPVGAFPKPTRVVPGAPSGVDPRTGRLFVHEFHDFPVPNRIWLYDDRTGDKQFVAFGDSRHLRLVSPVDFLGPRLR